MAVRIVVPSDFRCIELKLGYPLLCNRSNLYGRHGGNAPSVANLSRRHDFWIKIKYFFRRDFSLVRNLSVLKPWDWIKGFVWVLSHFDSMGTSTRQ